MVSLVLNRNILKLLVALAIPTSIAWFFIYSQDQANREVEAYKAEQLEHKTTDRVVIKNYELKEVDDANRLRWQLTAKSGEMDPDNRDVILEDVKVEYYDLQTKALKLRLIAPRGKANEASKQVVLNANDSGFVEAVGDKSRFKCKQVELIKQNQFLASGGVIIEWSGVAKVSGDSASGSTNLGNGPKDLKVRGNTHAEIMVN